MNVDNYCTLSVSDDTPALGVCGQERVEEIDRWRLLGRGCERESVRDSERERELEGKRDFEDRAALMLLPSMLGSLPLLRLSSSS